MRHLNASGAARPRGFTLIELMVALTIAALMLVASGAFFGEYMHNARLREENNALYSEVLMAQSEAIKRNGRVRLTMTTTATDGVNSSTLAVQDVRSNEALRSYTFTGGVTVEARVVSGSGAATLEFGSDGRPWPFGAAHEFDLSKSGVTCSDDIRCPALRVDAGGAIRQCANKTNCT